MEPVRLEVIDPQSPEGLLKSLRYRVRRYPTFVIEGKTKVVGWERERVDAAVTAALAAKGGQYTTGVKALAAKAPKGSTPTSDS
jgi:hypothetical protein